MLVLLYVFQAAILFFFQTVIGALLLVVIKPTDAPLIPRAIQSTYETCKWSIGGTENRNCPFYNSSPWSIWGCLAHMKKCSNVTDYHCAKDLDGKWTEACDKFQLCKEGGYALVTTQEIVV